MTQPAKFAIVAIVVVAIVVAGYLYSEKVKADALAAATPSPIDPTLRKTAL